MKNSLIYIGSVVAVNASFTYIPNFTLSDGTLWSIGSIVAGGVFIARDYAQKEVGHLAIIPLMLLAGAISYATSDAYVAIASIMAFFVSELVDYTAYTLTKGSIKKRVIASSLVGVPVDTAIFLLMIDSLSWFSFMLMTASKLIALSMIFIRGR